jgi:methyltransferase
MSWFIGVLAFLIVQRLTELWLANRNTARLLANGAVEHGREHYFLFVMLHTAWLVGMILAAPDNPAFTPLLFVAFVLLQLGRVWVIVTLGRFWTTRIISVPDAPLVASGPYRFVRHPNYLVVIGEIAIVPMLAGMWELAVIFSVLNAALLWHRIRVENQSLDQRTTH